MKNVIFSIVLSLILFTNCKEKTTETLEIVQKEQMVFTQDVDNFWITHDKIKAEKDSTKHLQILKDNFIDIGTAGVDYIMRARRYKPQEYVDMINNYPLLWETIREKTMACKDLGKEIDDGIERLRNLYPELKPAKVYFTVGVFRTGGTTIDGNVLIGAETAFGDKSVNVSQLPDSLNYIKKYWATKSPEGSKSDFARTNVHEYIHTQQNQDTNSNLLGIAVLEGVAEFVSTLAMGLEESPENAVQYGLQNDKKVKAAFERDMFSKDYTFWIWNDQENEFGTRDLAYYVGYAAVKKYYQQASDKQAAIKEMIELDHYNETEMEAFADKTGYFSKPIAELKKQYKLTNNK